MENQQVADIQQVYERLRRELIRIHRQETLVVFLEKLFYYLGISIIAFTVFIALDTVFLFPPVIRGVGPAGTGAFPVGFPPPTSEKADGAESQRLRAHSPGISHPSTGGGFCRSYFSAFLFIPRGGKNWVNARSVSHGRY